MPPDVSWWLCPAVGRLNFFGGFARAVGPVIEATVTEGRWNMSKLSEVRKDLNSNVVAHYRTASGSHRIQHSPSGKPQQAELNLGSGR